MWTRRKLFPTLDVPVTPQPAAVATPYFVQQQQKVKEGTADFTLDEDTYNFLASLGYTLVPSLSAEEAVQLLSWALPPRWVHGSSSAASSFDADSSRHAAYQAVLLSLLKNAEVLRACSQVEYFFFGTDNGQVFLLSLLPPHLLEALRTEVGDDLLPGLAQQCRREAELLHDASVPGNGNSTKDYSDKAFTAAMHRVPVNCVGRRLLHRHMREEPVTALDHLGVLLASAAPSVDHAVALSVFHPIPAGVVCIAHPCPVRSLKLWEGAVFTTEKTADADSSSADARVVASRQKWAARVREAEPVAVYVFTGDDVGVVRLWRVDVVARRYTLQHVLVCSPNMTGTLSPLDPFTREDTTKKVPARASDCALHCLDIDAARHRLLGGTEGGAYVWALDALPWRGADEATAAAAPASASTPASFAVQHPLCYDEASRAPLPCALRCWDAALVSSSAAVQDTEKVVEYRTARLVNHHVWVVDAASVQAEMARAQGYEQQQEGSGAEKVSGWKLKYGRAVTNGAAIGVVSNNVRLRELPNDSCDVAARLTRSVVTVTFDNGELRNDLRVPLSCVMPVLYPAAFLRTPGTACFAIRVLAPNRRVLTSCADGKVCVWTCKPSEDAHTAEAYVPQLISENRQEHRGLGRHLCVLRSPDVFVSCSFDDGLVKEWHVYDEPELLLRCARRFTLTPYISSCGGDGGDGAGNAKELANMFKSIVHPGDEAAQKAKAAADHRSGNSSGSDDDEADAIKAAEGGDVVAGISCAVAYPAFGALFLVGVFESAIQTYSLTEVVGCEPPRNYIYNGHKTVRLPAAIAEDVYHELL